MRHSCESCVAVLWWRGAISRLDTIAHSTRRSDKQALINTSALAAVLLMAGEEEKDDDDDDNYDEDGSGAHLKKS